MHEWYLQNAQVLLKAATLKQSSAALTLINYRTFAFMEQVKSKVRLKVI